jgi:hypothetical protein
MLIRVGNNYFEELRDKLSCGWRKESRQPFTEIARRRKRYFEVRNHDVPPIFLLISDFTLPVLTYDGQVGDVCTPIEPH